MPAAPGDHVTLAALRLSPKESGAARGIAAIDSRRAVQASKIRRQTQKLRTLGLGSRHFGSGDPLCHQICNLRVGYCALRRLRQVTAAITLRVQIVTPCAMNTINPEAFLHRSRCVFIPDLSESWSVNKKHEYYRADDS